jgi:hypothetical protein
MSMKHQNDAAFETDPVFEADLRAAMASEPAAAALRQRILERAPAQGRPYGRSAGGLIAWLGALDPRHWRLPALVELGAAAAMASLAIGLFVGANDLLGTGTAATAVADNSNTVDLVALAYESTGTAGGLQ